MKKYTWILGGLMALAITACTGDELMQNPEQQPAEGEVVTVTAYAPGSNADSRVNYVDGTNGNLFNLVWSVNDKFSVIVNSSYQTFTKVSNSDNFFSGTYPAGSGTYYAVYPYIASGTASGTASATAVPFDLSTQTGELDAKMTYMYASSADGRAFSFSHCMSILNASFTGLTEDATIKQIKVTTPDAYKVNGTINLSSGTLTGATENGTNDITITIPVEGVPVSQAEGEEDYYIYLPPMTANNEGNTLNFEVTTSDDAVYTGTISRNGAIEAGKLYTATVALSAPPTEPIPYLKFSSTAVNTIGLAYDRFPYNQNDLNYIEYSLDNGNTWAILEKNNAISFGYDQFERYSELLLRGICPDGTALSSNYTDYIQLLFSGEGQITCSGDIRTLVDYKNYQTVNLENKLFCSLFQQHANESFSNTQLRSAKNLILGDVVSAYCYYQMFACCRGLEEAPVLPATTLAQSCYAWMFYDCKPLNNVTMLAMDITATEALNGWLKKAGTQASNPTIYTADGVTLTEGTHYPDYWSEEVYNN